MTIAPEKTKLETGRVVAIAGPVVDVEFPPHALPEINHAVEMDLDLDGELITVTAEVAQQIGEGRVRCVCMKPTDGLVRGAIVRNTGRGISVPVGDAVLGHVFNVLGQPLDTDDIVRAMHEALDRGEALAAAGRRRAGEMTWRRTAELTLDAYWQAVR